MIKSMLAPFAALLTVTAAPIAAETLYFGDWKVTLNTDEMDVLQVAQISTKAEQSKYPALGADELTFMVSKFGVKMLSPATTSWPECKGGTATISVDGKKAQFVHQWGEYELCNEARLKPSTELAMKGGQTARLRAGYVDYTVSLKGFSAALAHAKKITR